MELQVAQYLDQSVLNSKFSEKELRQLISVIDLTTLQRDETREKIIEFCRKAETPLGNVAAICVYPEFISIVKEQAHKNIKICSVVNFPTGNEKLQTALLDIRTAISAGAQEIDVVFPYTMYLRGQPDEALSYISACKKECNNVCLKVILETSEFSDTKLLYDASIAIINAGADFLKTSTGKSKQGATFEAAAFMLLAIKSFPSKTVGFKASGGIKEIANAVGYINLAKKIMGNNWVKPENFRIGASALVDAIITYSHNQ